jgi:IS1 family transposase
LSLYKYPRSYAAIQNSSGSGTIDRHSKLNRSGAFIGNYFGVQFKRFAINSQSRPLFAGKKLDILDSRTSIGTSGFRRNFRGLSLPFQDSGLLNHHECLPPDGFQRLNCYANADSRGDEQSDACQDLRRKQMVEIAIRIIVGALLIFGGYLLIYYDDLRGRRALIVFDALGGTLLFLGFGCFFLPIYWQNQCDESDNQRSFHENTVTQKYYLTSANYCNTVLSIGSTQMANILSTEKQVAIISGLAEGSSIRSLERITGVHRDTIVRLGVRVGQGCQSLLDAKMRELSCQRLQFDEVWGFIGKKEKHVRPEDNPTLGDVWTWVAIDADTKLVPTFKVGKRDHVAANAFVADVASRMANRVQISTDGLRAYVEAIEASFGSIVDYAQIVKIFESEAMDAEVIGMDKTRLSGRPDMRHASTSYVERLNGTTRQHMRRLTRLTYAFSKKLENFEAAVGLHFAYYNFVKRHNTLRATPAMAAGIERDFWTVADLVEAAA